MDFEKTAATATLADSDRVTALVEIGVDSPLKLDLLASLEYGSKAYEGTAELAVSCGVSPRDVVPPLEQLVKAKLVRCRRLYNIAEYASSPSDELRARIRSLLGATPAEMRRLRCMLLARSHVGAIA